LKTYQKKLKKLLTSEIVDIILFGSFVKGGSKYSDIDVAVISQGNSDMELKNNIIKILGEKSHVQILGKEFIYSQMMITIIKEGFSVRKNKFLSEFYGVEPVVLFKYNIRKLSATQKVQFTRGLVNTVNEIQAKKLTRTTVLVPMANKVSFDEFLELWEVKFESKSYELIPLVRSEKL